VTTVNRIYAKLAEKDANSDVEKMRNYYQITTDGKKTSDNA
jgi:predicted transcriptional regulator